MLIKLDEKTWIDPRKVNYLFLNSDGDAVLGCGDEHFHFYASYIQELAEKINDAIAIEEAFDKVKA